MATILRNNWSGGMALGSQITQLPPNTATLMRNVVINQGGYIGNRNGFKKHTRDVVKVSNLEQPITGMFEYNLGSTKELILSMGTTIKTYDSDSGNFTDSGLTITAGTKLHFAPFYNKVVISDGVNTVITYDGTTWTEDANIPLFTFSEEFNGNLFVWGIESGGSFNTPDVTQFCNDYDVTDFPATYYRFVSKSKFDAIKGMRSVNDSLGAALFTKDNVYTLTGTGHNNYRFDLLAAGVGCVAFESIQVKNGQVIWLDEDGFYTLNGQQPVRYAELDSVFRSIDFSRLSSVWSIVYRGFDEKANQYWCGITLGSGSGFTDNNYVFMYDFDTGGWVYFINLPCDILAKGLDSNENEIILASNNTDGWVYQLDVGDNDDGSPINSTFIDAPQGHEEPNMEKHLEYIHLWYRSKYNGTFKVLVTSDYSGNTFPKDGTAKDITMTAQTGDATQYTRDILDSTNDFLKLKDAKYKKITVGSLKGKYHQLRIDCNDANQDWDIFQIGYEYSDWGETIVQ